jgi:hypothetical protein
MQKGAFDRFQPASSPSFVGQPLYIIFEINGTGKKIYPLDAS